MHVDRAGFPIRGKLSHGGAFSVGWGGGRMGAFEKVCLFSINSKNIYSAYLNVLCIIYIYIYMYTGQYLTVFSRKQNRS